MKENERLKKLLSKIPKFKENSEYYDKSISELQEQLSSLVSSNSSVVDEAKEPSSRESQASEKINKLPFENTASSIQGNSLPFVSSSPNFSPSLLNENTTTENYTEMNPVYQKVLSEDTQESKAGIHAIISLQVIMKVSVIRINFKV